MGLTREQYNRVMRIYQDRRIAASERQAEKLEEIYNHVPAVRTIDDQMRRLYVANAKARLKKDEKAERAALRELSELAAKKEECLRAAGYEAADLAVQYTCPHCQDTGYLSDYSKCGCLKRIESELIYNNSGLPERLAKESFETFSFDAFDDTKPLREFTELYRGLAKRGQQAGAEALPPLMTQRRYMHNYVYPLAKKYVMTFESEPGQNIYMTGKTGVGKTFLSNCIAKELIERQHTVVYILAGELFELYSRVSFGGETDEALKGRLDEIANCELLILDDLGSEMTTSFVKAKLFTLVSHRLLNKTSTIISSNLSPNQFTTVYEDRLMSRILENYIHIPFYGEDIRKKKAGEKK